MKNKVLIVTTTPYMIRQFLMNDISILQDLDYQVEVATNFKSFNVIDDESLEIFRKKLESMNITIHQINFPRRIFSIFELLKSYKEMKRVLSCNYKLMHTHTPIASVISRLASKKFKSLKVIYTAHGFHFYKGAPIKNWMIFYPIEKWLSRYTDILITINKEDYKRAKSKFKMKSLVHIPGVGIDFEKYQLNNFNRECYRKKLGFSEDDYLILSVGELNNNKNHEVILKAIAKLNNPNIKYVIAGQGRLKEYLLKLSEDLNIKSQLVLLGFRNDIPELAHCAEIFAFPSKREGLGLSALEAMACGRAIITSTSQGINDYSENGYTGFKFKYNDTKGFERGIRELIQNESLRKKMEKNCKKVALKFDKKNTKKIMKEIYLSIER